MKGDIDLREIKLEKLRLSRRNLMMLAVAIVALLACALTWRYVTHPPRAWLVRWKLDRYLKKQAHTGNFKVDFAFPSKAEMAKPSISVVESAPKVGSRTGKTFDALREEYLSQKTAAVALERIIVRSETELKESAARLDALSKQVANAVSETNLPNVQSNVSTLQGRIESLRKAPSRRPEWREKEQAITPIEEDLWEFQRLFTEEAAVSQNAGNAALAKARAQFTDESEKKLTSASSYDAMYKAIGQELFVAKGLLASGNPEHRKQGVLLALAASRHATAHAVNGAVAGRICEGYVLPNLDLANDANRRSPFNEENLLRQCADIFERNYEFNNVVRTYQIFLDGVGAKNADRADWARSQIGQAHEQAGDAKQALQAYREIRNTNNYRNIFFRTVPRLEKQLKG
jgi:hypothetical protein